MAQDLVKGLMNDPEFNVTVTDMFDGLLIQTNKPKQLVSLILRRQRQKRRLKLEDIAKHLNAKSLNEYAQYEQGKHMPSIEKLEQLLEAIDPQLSPYVSFLESK